MTGDHENMRDNKTEKYVRVVSTGHAEADMLGQVLLWLDKRQNSNLSQRPHRGKQTKSIFRVVVKCIQTTPSACWRSLNVLINKGKSAGRRVVGEVRKLFVNGK